MISRTMFPAACNMRPNLCTLVKRSFFLSRGLTRQSTGKRKSKSKIPARLCAVAARGQRAVLHLQVLQATHGGSVSMGKSSEIKPLLPSPKIAPSMLSSDFANLASEAKFMLESGADWLHMDVMLFVLSSEWVKGRHFVPNLTIGAPVIQSLRKHTDAFLDCHLMVTNPSDYVEPFAKAGASSLTFHVEAARDNWQDIVNRIKAFNMRAGVALKPGTPVEEVYPLIDGGVDMVLVMTVEPGFGGQKFMPETMSKVQKLRAKYPTLDIEVDGGLGPSTIDQAASAGANCIVAGSSVFGSKDPAGVISSLRSAVLQAQA